MPELHPPFQVTIEFPDDEQLEFEVKSIRVKSYGEILVHHDEMGITISKPPETL